MKFQEKSNVPNLRVGKEVKTGSFRSFRGKFSSGIGAASDSNANIRPATKSGMNCRGTEEAKVLKAQTFSTINRAQ